MEKDDLSGSFRDRLYTIDESGKRLWVFARKPRGPLTTRRNVIGILLMSFFFTAPFIRINGQPLLLLDFMHRTFVIFGVQFWPQDFHLFFIGMIALIVFIILFTATYGRLWCGWACPQTVFMEILFRRIEYWIDGSAQRQKELRARSWNADKIFRRVLKHGIFYLIAFIIGNYFLMYLIGSDDWLRLVTEPPSQHAAGLTGMVIFSFIFYFIFSWFREQVCTIVCPYGRLQGVLLDRDSVVISYDYNRGEERGSLRKGEDRKQSGKGDCVDCGLCVAVCPTGIDVRNGTQLECINCACCIDACNETMQRSGFRPGLIRYASEKMIAEGKPWHFTWRSSFYTAVLGILLAALTWFLTTRNPVEATVLRSPGMLFQEQEGGRISNLYSVKVVNKSGSDLTFEIRELSGTATVQVIGKPPMVAKQSLGETVFFLVADKGKLHGSKTEMEIGIFSGGKMLDKTRATFVGPEK
ncbi:MAG TPA: cytochrome c oxidase accessory protein CcoG [Bacteroidales bacterium]|nr:cytochrome c oxidase accessory protein CcoG [Bacteroidales bacterium]HPS61738.1 cytochrome c oxidase accessory protein CcoG [Bacteroidales bacterium]